MASRSATVRAAREEQRRPEVEDRHDSQDEGHDGQMRRGSLVRRDR